MDDPKNQQNIFCRKSVLVEAVVLLLLDEKTDRKRESLCRLGVVVVTSSHYHSDPLPNIKIVIFVIIMGFKIGSLLLGLWG